MKQLKKSLLLMTVLPLVGGVSSCWNKTKKLDYSKAENWYRCSNSGTKEVDTFYIYPTMADNAKDLIEIKKIREIIDAEGLYNGQPKVYENATNVYMPLYRQISFNEAIQYNHDTFLEFLFTHQGYKDVCDSLDYYFKNYNKNKPFILAGHSQGSAILFNILTDYMQQHQEYLSRMVACYSIGYGYSKKEISKYPSLKFATGETDTNCIISYNTFGPEHSGGNLLLAEDSYCINPLNWKTDDTYAPIELNKGSFKGAKICEPLSDAKVNVEEGYLISNANKELEVPGVDSFFGTHSFHLYDYGFYYVNLEENVQKRVDAFLKK